MWHSIRAASFFFLRISDQFVPRFTSLRSVISKGNLFRCFTFDDSFPIVKMSVGETACSYASLILHDEGIAVTSDNIVTLLKSANVQVDSFWPTLFAKLAEKKNLGDLIANAAGGGAPVAVAAAPVAAAAGGGAAAAPAAEEKKKEEPEEESDDDMGFGLFD
ncbi:hypothetical protein VNO80_27373 [Phaseolus coccineus]|uniref:60S acidic ribosomal protein P1 n=1 Tax=Phaseolus coccineus TaxID=3886 RepID=A0AAN9QHF0_PHACN